ncbi:YdcF family protein [Xanthobacter sp. V3C-3]|uniref:YdcF family protein n=1 Tax=Xanthobacter lutulentifluminis TaxID=3119935 RepID=UPI00372B4AD4
MTMSNAGRPAARPQQPATVRPATGRTQAGARPRRSRTLRRIAVGLVLLAGLGGVAAAAGFIAFTAQIAAREPVAVKSADAIVVLTGGPSRIVDAVGLLAEGRGRRLLITGVNPSTSTEEMRRALPDGEHLLGCCIDLGHKALNTRGNALEAAEWARDRRFRSLVVVTSSWHMPRAMMELGRALPEVELVAYPVVTTRTQPERWWSDPGTLKLLAKEYVKFIMATVKIRPAQAVAGAGAPPQASPAPGPATQAPASLAPAAQIPAAQIPASRPGAPAQVEALSAMATPARPPASHPVTRPAEASLSR